MYAYVCLVSGVRCEFVLKFICYSFYLKHWCINKSMDIIVFYRMYELSGVTQWSVTHSLLRLCVCATDVCYVLFCCWHTVYSDLDISRQFDLSKNYSQTIQEIETTCMIRRRPSIFSSTCLQSTYLAVPPQSSQILTFPCFYISKSKHNV